MQLNDIIALAKAGFTAEQIGALAQLPADQPQPPPQPEPQPQPVPQPEPQAKTLPAADPLQAVLAELGVLKGQIQQINVAGAQQPQPAPKPPELTGEQILANIISPPRQGGAN